MPMMGEEISQSDVSKPSKPEVEEETSDTPVVGGAEKCELTPELGDLSQSSCGERDETVPLEGASAEAKGREDSESPAAEFPVDTEADMNELPVMVEEEVAAGEEGGDGMVVSQSEDRQPEMNDVEREAVVTDTVDAPTPAQLTVVASQVAAAPIAGEVGIGMNDTRSSYESKAEVKADLVDCAPVPDSGDAPMSNESEIDTEVDELSSVVPKSEMKVEEEFSSMVNSNSEMTIIESGPSVDAREDEILVDPQFEVKADQDLSSVVDPQVQASGIDAGDAQQISELQIHGKGDDLLVDLEGMVALVNKSEGHLSDEMNNEAAGVDSLMVDSCEVGNKVATVVEGGKVHVEKVDVLMIDSEDGNIEKSVGIEEENVDSLTPKVTPITGHEMDVKTVTEVSASVVDTGEHEHVPESIGGLYNYRDDKLEHAEENLTSGNMVMEDNSMSVLLGDHMTMTENKDAIVREDLPESNDKDKTDMGKELELPRNVVAGDTQLDDAEFETKKEIDESAYRTSDEDGKLETWETNSDADEPGHDLYDSPAPLDEEEDEAMAAEEEIETQDTEMETEADVADSEKASGGKRKRAKLSKNSFTPRATTKASSRKTVGEDVCFICFDGGELVLCDRRGCPKAYHPSCVNRDEAFFKSKGRWNCGWHLCSICEKNAQYMCYTCTFSLCKSCTKGAVILCVRGNKGFCQTCMRTVRLIENNEQGSQDAQVDFDDRNSWEYLFKDYYIELKAKLSLSSDEIAEAKNPWKGANVMAGPSKREFSEAQADANDGGSDSDDSIENIETMRPKRKKTRKQPKSRPREKGLVSTGVDNPEWASKELLEFVSHMKDGNTSLLSQFDVQALLLEYIKRNKLRDPRRKSQIMCDARLENLFGKPRVAHFEMLKLLESHFLVRDEQNDDFQGSVVDTENNQLDVDGNGDTQAKGSKDRKRKSRKKSDRGPRNNLDDYAAIDMHNIGLIYLRRKLMEDLLDDAETFHDKAIGTFVRIRISGSNQKQDLYRLVQVVGTSKAAEPYKIGKKSTDTMVEILNLDKTEIISIDTISNQEFTEEECKRLRQSIKCGLISRLTVGEILDKTTEIRAARVNDWLESETQRLSHLRDRASDMGHRKELRECVEKLQLLKTPEERRRRIDEIPEIHADPKMDPSYESDDNDSENEDSRRDAFMRARGINRRPRAPISPVTDSSTKITTKNWESSKYLLGSNASHVGEIVNENSRNLRVKGTDELNNLDKRNFSTKYEHIEGGSRSIPGSDLYSSVSSVVTPLSSLSAGAVETAVKINESEKIWHYKDPSGKVQGPFSMVQLRKWNNTGYFPAELRIWRSTEKQENSILLADALEGKFPKESPAVNNNTPATDNTTYSSHSSASHSLKTSEISLHEERSNLDQNLRSYSRPSAEKWRGNDFANLPSPTPRQTNSSWDAKERGPLSVATNQTPVINEVLSSPTPVSPYIETRSSAAASLGVNPPVQTAPFSPTPDSLQATMLTPAVSLNVQPNSTGEPPAVSPHAIQMHPPPTAGIPSVQQTIGQSPTGYVWAPANVPLNVSGSFPNSGVPSFPNSGAPPAGLQPDPWRPVQANQPNASWNVGPTENSANPNVGWTTNMMQPNPNMGWTNLPPGNNVSANWGPPAVSNWGVAPPGNVGPNSAQGPMPGYVNPGWGGPPSVQGPAVGNGWGPPSGNTGGPPPPAVQAQPQQENMSQGSSWGGGGGEQNHMGGQYSGGMGGQGRDSSYRGGPRPWNRPSSFGGGGFRKRDRVCPYNTNGRCRKGMHCDYLHT